MSNLNNLKVMSVLCFGLLVVLAFLPQWTQAKVTPTIAGPVESEGDPLDSNDYSSGGGGDTTDNDLHQQTVVPDQDLGGKPVYALLLRKGSIFVPFFYGPIMNIQIIDLPMRHSAAVEYAD